MEAEKFGRRRELTTDPPSLGQKASEDRWTRMTRKEPEIRDCHKRAHGSQRAEIGPKSNVEDEERE